MIKSLELFKKDKDWLGNNGQYIPHPSTWLNQKRWEEKMDILEKKENTLNNTEEYIALDTQDITDEEYSKLLNGEITIQDIQKN